jgi:hypothetical protein
MSRGHLLLPYLIRLFIAYSENGRSLCEPETDHISVIRM